MMKRRAEFIMLMAVAMSCYRTDYSEPFKKRIKDYAGTFFLTEIEWGGLEKLDLDGDGISSSDIMSEFEALDQNMYYLQSSKIVSVPDEYSDVNTFLARIPVQCGFLSDEPAEKNWAQIGYADTEIVYEFDESNDVHYYLPSGVKAEYDPLSCYDPQNMEFKSGQAKYYAEATFYDFLRNGFVSGPVVFIFERK